MHPLDFSEIRERLLAERRPHTAFVARPTSPGVVPPRRATPSLPRARKPRVAVSHQRHGSFDQIREMLIAGTAQHEICRVLHVGYLTVVSVRKQCGLRSRFTPPDIRDEIIARLKTGEDHNAIAADVKVTVDVVKNWKARLGLCRKNHRLTETQKEQIRELCGQGLGSKKIARLLSLKPSTVCNHLRLARRSEVNLQ